MLAKIKKEVILDQLNQLKFEEEIIFSHINLGFFGMIENIETTDQLSSFFYQWLNRKLRSDQIFITPAFSFSFSSNRSWKVNKFRRSETNSKVGFFSNWLIKNKIGLRTHDPISSVIMIGNTRRMPNAITSKIPDATFGESTVWEQLDLADSASLVNINMDLGSTFLHYIERKFNVPHRQCIPLTGKIDNSKVTIEYYARVSDKIIDDFEKVHRSTKNLATTYSVGRGRISEIKLKDYKRIIENKLRVNPSYYLKEN